MSQQILIIEDNADIAGLVMVNLRDRLLQVDHAANGRIGLDKARSGSYDLIILDLMLPEVDGLDICRSLRNARVFTPVLMITARSSELDRVLGLEVGADDYLTKPFSVPELVARVKAILRRVQQYQPAQAKQNNARLHFGALSIDPDTRQVRINDHDVELTAREFDLLWHFASHPQHGVTG